MQYTAIKMNSGVKHRLSIAVQFHTYCTYTFTYHIIQKLQMEVGDDTPEDSRFKMCYNLCMNIPHTTILIFGTPSVGLKS